jgi:hypothetical protein
MKSLLFLTASFAGALAAAGCGGILDQQWRLSFPESPASWSVLPGEPSWHIEWLRPDGSWAQTEKRPGEDPALDLSETWPAPVIAWPYIPGTPLQRGSLKPAGAIHPHDVQGGHLHLSWQGGVEAVLYREMSRQERGDTYRGPQYFDWPRFRSLFAEPDTEEERKDTILEEGIRSDPWDVDWKGAAEKIVKSGFDRRRIKLKEKKEIAVPAPAGPWFSASPFAPELAFGKGDVPVFPLGREIDIWFSVDGLLKASEESWIFLPW